MANGDVDEPAIGPVFFRQTGTDLDKVADKEARRIDEVAAMRQHEVSGEVSLGIFARLLRAGAQHGQRLHGIRHRVAMGGIAVPGLQRQHFAHLVAHEIASRFETRIEALHVADLQDLA